MKDFVPMSEWSAPAIRLEAFVLTPAWRALPLPIKAALARVWRAEQAEQDDVAVPCTDVSRMNRSRSSRFRPRAGR